MDRKILTVSIMTILVLLGALLVVGLTGIYSTDFGLVNITTNGTLSNWSGVDLTAGAPLNMENLTFAFTLNHRTATNADPNNITNITIRPHGVNSSGNTEDIGNMTMVAINSTWTESPTGVRYDAEFGCGILGDGLTIQCLNNSPKGANVGATNISGNGSFVVWTLIEINSTAREQAFDWELQVTDNNSDFSSTTLSGWGIDGLPPRLIEFNVTDGTRTRSSRLDELNGSTTFSLSNNSDIIVKFKMNESNRAKGVVLLFWNETSGRGDSAQNLTIFSIKPYNNTVLSNGSWDLRNNDTCNRQEDTGTSLCFYDLHIAKGNFTHDKMFVTFSIFTNDSFNQTAYFNNFDVSFDGENPEASVSVTKDAVTYSQGEVTVSCTGSDVNETSDITVEQIVLVKPNGEEVIVNDVEETIFRNDDTGLAGEYKAYCSVQDMVSRSAESGRESFNIYYKTHHAGPSAPSRVAGVDISTTATPSGSIGGKQGESETFTLDGTTAHRLTFITIGTDSVTMQIESEPIEITLGVGESKEITLDGDSVKITLDSITNGKASVTIVNVVKEAEAAEAAEAGEGVTTEEGGISTWLIVLIIIVILVVIYFVIKGRKGKKGEFSFSRKDLV